MEIKIDRELVVRLAWLTRLKITEKEAKKLIEDFKRIIEFFNKIDELREVIKETEPLYHVLELSTVVRSDKPKTPLSREEILSIAPESEEGFIKAPWRAR